MSVKYQEYRVITEETSPDLEKRVNELLQKGWVPIGGVSITYVHPRYITQYSQAIALLW